VVLAGATVINMSDQDRLGSPPFAQRDEDHKVWAAYHRAQLAKKNLQKAVVTGRPAFGSDDRVAEPVLQQRDAMNEAALATILMSVELVPVNTVTSIDTAKEAWDAIKVLLEAPQNARLV